MYKCLLIKITISKVLKFKLPYFYYKIVFCFPTFARYMLFYTIKLFVSIISILKKIQYIRFFFNTLKIFSIYNWKKNNFITFVQKCNFKSFLFIISMLQRNKLKFSLKLNCKSFYFK